VKAPEIEKGVIALERTKKESEDLSRKQKEYEETKANIQKEFALNNK